MKKILILLSIMSLNYGNAKAQLIVDSLGSVGIGTVASPVRALGVEAGSKTAAAIFGGGRYCLYIKNNFDGDYTPNGIRINNFIKYGKSSIGMNITSDVTITNRRLYGIQSVSGLSTAGSYGVWGGLRYNNNVVKGAGIFGSSTSTGYIYNTYSGVYAGFFLGDVRVTGTLYGTLLTPTEQSTSQTMLNTDVVQAFTTSIAKNEERVSDKLQQVQLLQFYRSPDRNKLSPIEIQEQKKVLTQRKANLKDAEEIEDVDEKIVTEIPQTELSTIRYGLAADQLKAVYPELVYEDKDGNVSVNYIEMIPLLVQAVNELKAENQKLSKEIKALKGEDFTMAKARATAEEVTAINTADEQVLTLAQNVPNPFSEQTNVEVSIPESVRIATLFIYDMSGKQIRRIDIDGRGILCIPVTSEGLTEGMYLYSLVADGKMVGTKKTILSK